ncbi:MAG TPA: DUF6247 family protein [Nocardioidaceae bacterium]|nr:DUF6247 family protein [Nocardioidaceae bacterium]
MTAQPSPIRHDPDDPAEILRLLPEQYHAQFRREYAGAVEQARRPEQFRVLHELLRLWRLRAVAYSDSSYASRLASADHDAAGDVPIEDVVNSWPQR